MATSRPLTEQEERKLVRRIRKASARDRALVCSQLYLGYRISELLALKVAHVCHGGALRERVSVPPRLLKGGYGRTRSVIMCQELRRALAAYLHERESEGALAPDQPLFVSRNHASGGALKALSRSGAEKLIKRHLGAVCGGDPTGVSTHSLRKRFATAVYEATGHDILSTRDALGHSSVAVTQLYLRANQATIDAAVLRADRSRQPRTRARPSETVSSRTDSIKPSAPAPVRSKEHCNQDSKELHLPGLEGYAA